LSPAEKSTAEQSGYVQRGVRKAAEVVFMVFGTMCFASKSIFVKWAYEQGAQPEAVLLYRQLFAAPLFWLIFRLSLKKQRFLKLMRPDCFVFFCRHC